MKEIKEGLYNLLETNKHPKITLFCPFSRAWMVDRWFDALHKLDLPYSDFGLFFYVDNNNDGLMEKVYGGCLQLMALSKYNGSIPDAAKVGSIKILYHNNETLRETRGYLERRERVARIHNEAKQYIMSQYIFGLEDDTIVPRGTFWRLYKAMLDNRKIGFVEGVEVGRWGLLHIGGWRVHARDNYGDPTDMETVEYQESGIMDIDGGGLYCFLTKGDLYRSHDFLKYQEYEFAGPDLTFGLHVKDSGFRCIIDYDLICDHFQSKRGVLRPYQNDIVTIRFRKSTDWTAEVNYQGKPHV